MGRPMGRKNNMRTSEEKEKIVLEYLNGRVGYKTVARSYNIHPSRFFIWIKNYREKGIEGLKSKIGKCAKKKVVGRPKKAETRSATMLRPSVAVFRSTSRSKNSIGQT